MTTSSKIQFRGICQCCGREQAVVRGRMSKHGYTVEQGWFSGVCTGQHYAPMQHDRKEADSIAAIVSSQAAALRAAAAALTVATVPADRMVDTNRSRREGAKWVAIQIAFGDMSEYSKEEYVRSEQWRLTRRAELGESFAADLLRMADEYHGKALREVPAEPAAERICVGDQRVSPRGVLTVTMVDGARVYWKDERGFKSWTGAQAWRRMPKAAVTA